MNKLLIISPAFPPLNTADLHRVRMSLPHYRENGWEPVVLCVAPECQDSPREEALLATVPRDVRVFTTGALPRGLCRLFGVGNLGLRSFWHMFFAGLRLIRRERPGIVFLSTTQFILFPLARIWTALTGVPCVIDLHDPWVTDAYRKPGAPPPPGGWKYRFADLSSRMLEGWSLRRLGGLMSVSGFYIGDLCSRHPWFAAVPARVIGFGASELDLACAPPPPAATAADGRINVVYTGASGPGLNRIIPGFLDGLALLRARDPQAAARLRIHFVGTCQVAPGSGKPTVLPLAEARGVGDLVCETPHRLGHLECLARQRDADLLLLLGSVDPAYSPSKLYPYILAGRPILAVAVKGGALEALLMQLCCSRLVSADGTASTAGAVADALADAAHGRTVEDVGARNLELFRSEHLAPALVRRQCAFFSEVLARARNPEASA